MRYSKGNQIIMQTNSFVRKKKAKCALKLLKCHHASESDGDEIYLKHENKKIWPDVRYKVFKSADEMSINIDLELKDNSKPVTIELWEKDLFKDDFLGSFQFVPFGSVGEFIVDLKKKKTTDIQRYSLVWKA